MLQNSDVNLLKSKYYNALNYIPSLGPVRIKNLVIHLGHPERIFEVSAAKLAEAEGVGMIIAKKIVRERSKVDIEASWAELKKKDISVVNWEDPSYPYLLLQTYDPPPLLYYCGRLECLQRNCLAIVGSRKHTAYGKEIAHKFAAKLSNYGITIVSGMARGIDTFTHKGVLEGGGETVAVLGCGIDICYPPENKELKRDIQRSGVLLSEFPPGVEPLPQNFPRRNRLISGISLGVMVIEAGEKSGALITAGYALEQDREVFAVPAGIGSPYSRGCHRLIKEGAKLVENLDDVLVELYPQLTITEGSSLIENEQEKHNIISEEEEKLLKIIHYEPLTMEEIIYASGFSPAAASSLLLELEMKGVIKQLPGNYYVRTSMEVC